MAKGKSRDRAKERSWRRHVRAQQVSGQSVPGYCRERGLSSAGFYWWRRELARRAGLRHDLGASAPQARESDEMGSDRRARRATQRRASRLAASVESAPERQAGGVSGRGRKVGRSDTLSIHDRPFCAGRSGRGRPEEPSDRVGHSAWPFAEVKVMGGGLYRGSGEATGRSEESLGRSGGEEAGDAVTAASSSIEVCLAGGRTIRVGRHFDGATLLRVVALLEGGRRC